MPSSRGKQRQGRREGGKVRVMEKMSSEIKKARDRVVKVKVVVARMIWR